MQLSRQQLPAAIRRFLPGGEPSCLPIGLDLGQGVVRMVQCKLTDTSSEPGPAREGNRELPLETASVRIESAERRELHQNYSQARGDHVTAARQWESSGPIVAELLKRGRFEGRRVCAVLPRPMQMIKTLRLQSSRPQEMPRLIAEEASTGFGIDLASGDFIVHFLPGDVLRRGSDQFTEGLLLIARRSDVDRYVATLHEWGAEVVSVDFSAVSLYRGLGRFGRRQRDEDEVHVVVDVGRSQSQVLIGRGRRLSFNKSIGIGGETFSAAVAKKLGVSLSDADLLRRRLARQLRAKLDAFQSTPSPREVLEALIDDPVHRSVQAVTRSVVEDLARELSLCLRYYSVTFRGQPPSSLNLCGGIAEDPAFRAWLDLALPVEVKAHAPITELMPALETPAESAIKHFDRPTEWATALGAALQQAPSGLSSQHGRSRRVQEEADLREMAGAGPSDSNESPSESSQHEGEAAHA